MSCNLEQRRMGVLLHPTSLPSGTLDDGERWLDFMAEAGLSLWQVLPLGVPQIDRSPYQCLSAFATNPALRHELPPLDANDAGFAAFQAEEAHWLRDYALFIIIKQQQQGAPWYDWPDELKWRQATTLEALSKAAAASLLKIEWEQYQLYLRWQALRQYAGERGIYLFGDMPIFVAWDSADVWACPQRFLLDDQGHPSWVTGVPPDYFSETGQRWGNPHYDWDYHRAEGFDWWLKRLRHHFRWFDLVRIDHFRGLQAVWMIDAREPTAINGHWAEVPGDELLARLQQDIDPLPLVAEDLGIITPEVRALKEKYNLPGMAVLQFSFDAFDDNPHKPKNIQPRTVVYTGTHDNDTTRGWFEALPPDTQTYVRQTLGIAQTDDIVQAMIRTCAETRGNLVVIPLQDYLGLGSEARMNTPGTTTGNWSWRFDWPQLQHGQLAASIRQLVISTRRGETP